MRDLRPAIEKNWIQERNKRLQELNENEGNFIDNSKGGERDTI